MNFDEFESLGEKIDAYHCCEQRVQEDSWEDDRISKIYTKCEKEYQSLLRENEAWEAKEAEKAEKAETEETEETEDIEDVEDVNPRRFNILDGCFYCGSHCGCYGCDVYDESDKEYYSEHCR